MLEIKNKPAITPATQTNGASSQLPTFQAQVRAFYEELKALKAKYGVELVPVIKRYNNGTEIADIEVVAIK